MDKAARALNIDPIDIRRRNLIDKFPYTSAMGLVFDESAYKETLELAVQHIDALRSATGRRQRAQGKVSRSRLCDILGAQPAMAARHLRRAHGDHAGWETVELTIDPSAMSTGIGSSPHGQGLAPRWRRSSLMKSASSRRGSRSFTGRIRPARPMVGARFASRSLVICGGRNPDRGAEDAAKALEDREPYPRNRGRAT